MHDSNRKNHPIYSGLMAYFPKALAAVAGVSMEGARKHDTFNAEGYPTWDRSKSADDADALARHLLDKGKVDTDGYLHSAKVAWRALAVLEKELDALDGIEAENERKIDRRLGDKVMVDEFVAQADALHPGMRQAGAGTMGHPPLLAADFAMWLTTREKCVHVGAKHEVYDMIDALEEYTQLIRGKAEGLSPGLRDTIQMNRDADLEKRSRQREHNKKMSAIADKIANEIFYGVDPARPGSDETKIAVFGYAGTPIADVAAMLGVRVDQVVDLRHTDL